MGLLTREDLLTKEKLDIVKVELGEGKFVFVRQMTGRERDQFEQSMLKKHRDAKGNVLSYEQVTEDFRAKLAVCTVCDEEGKLLLRTTDIAALSSNMSAKTLETIITKAQELNKITEEDKENLVKNSEVGQADNSPSDSVES